MRTYEYEHLIEKVSPTKFSRFLAASAITLAYEAVYCVSIVEVAFAKRKKRKLEFLFT